MTSRFRLSLGFSQVGLAVDDIKAVQDSAVLQRLAMQVTLNLDVEKMLPDFLRRKVIRRMETVYPNQKKNILSKVFQDDNTLKRIAKAIVEKGNEVTQQLNQIILKIVASGLK